MTNVDEFENIVWLEYTMKQIPADMVVNAILVSTVAHANQHSDMIYHVGSSVANPVRYLNLRDCAVRYFKEKPWINKEGKAVKVGKVTILSNMDSFYRYMYIRYQLPLKVNDYFKSLISIIHPKQKHYVTEML